MEVAVQGDAAALTAPHYVPCSTWTDTHVPEDGTGGFDNDRADRGVEGRMMGTKENTTGASDIQISAPDSSFASIT